jgi:hypothetical protein
MHPINSFMIIYLYHLRLLKTPIVVSKSYAPPAKS